MTITGTIKQVIRLKEGAWLITFNPMYKCRVYSLEYIKKPTFKLPADCKQGRQVAASGRIYLNPESEDEYYLEAESLKCR
jgi:hypothetical protein